MKKKSQNDWKLDAEIYITNRIIGKDIQREWNNIIKKENSKIYDNTKK